MFTKIDRTYIFMAVTALAAILFTVIYLYSPLESDDYWFLMGTQGMKHGVDMFLVACDTMTERWYTETGRLGNLINPLFLALLPKWVFDVISGLMFFLSVVFCCRLASAKYGSLGSYLLLAGMVFCFPWYDYMFCVTFGINYLWGIALALMAAYYLLTPTRHGWRLVIVCVLCFCAGWFHEGFGAPLSCGAAAVALLRLRKGDLRMDFIAKAVSLFAGTLMICTSPVFWSRAENHVSNIVKFPFKELVMQVGPSILIFGIFMIALILAFSIAGNRKRLRAADAGYERTVFFAILLAAAMTVTVKYYNGPRTGAAVVVFGVVATVWLLEKCSLRVMRSQSWGVGCVELLISVAVMMNLCFAAIAQRKLLREYHEIVSLFQASADGTIYFDITFPNPDLSLYKTTVRQFHERSPKYQIALYLDSTKTLVIMPKALENIGEADIVPASRRGFYICKGYILCEPWAVPSEYTINVIGPEGREMSTRFRQDPFLTASGRQLVFVMPHLQTLDSTLRIADVVE